MALTRGQAAVFDGIFFLLITSASIAMMFVFLVNYGAGQEKVLQTAHVVNYMTSAFKEVYFLDASLLSKAANDGRNYDATLPNGKLNPYGGLANPNTGCPSLGRFTGSVSVADLLKKDLADGLMDDKYGSIGNVLNTTPPGAIAPSEAPGKTALRCAVKEVMKPFEAAGYSYFVEVFDSRNVPTYPTTRAAGGLPGGTNAAVDQTDPSKSVVTNSPLAIGATPKIRQCEDVTSISAQNLVVASPFRVITAASAAGGQESQAFVIRLCIWPQTPAERH